MGNQAEEKIEQYIREISRHLVIPHDMKKRVESDLRTDFYLRIEAGKDVDEVIKEMGDPGETAASFNEEMEGGEPATPWRFHKIFLVAAGLALLAFVIEFICTCSMMRKLDNGIAIIGNADGNTSVFLAGKIINPFADILWGLAAVLGLLALYFLTSRSVSYGRNRGALLCSLAGTLCLISGFAAHIPIGMAEGQGPYGYIEMMLNGKNILLILLALIPLITLVLSIRRKK